MSEHVIWAIEARIKDGQQAAFDAFVRELIEATRKEPGTLAYEWSIGEDGRSVHVYERYADTAAVMAHMGTWGPRAGRFAELAETTRMVVLTDLDPALRHALAEVNPTYMKPIGGFARL